MQPLTVERLTELLALASSRDVEAFLARVVAPNVLMDEAYWRPVGDQRSNAGAIEASADEINPLVERVVNSMEAVIELKVEEWLRQHPALDLPRNPKAAIEVHFGIPRGESRLLSDDEAPPFAGHVEMILRGERDNPTIVVRDLGIGIHPDDFLRTIVSLGQSEKGEKPYLIGMYGQGGSSTFDKCEYSVIISRRHTGQLGPGQMDLVGWTVVRRKLATRSHVYSYLVDPQEKIVPRFSGTIADAIGFKHGTYISHIQYRNLGQFAHQEITNYAYYTLNYRLFDPLIPWTLSDERESRSRTTRTMRGVPYRLKLLPITTGLGASPVNRRTTSVRHNITFEYSDPFYGRLTVEWWILQDEQVQEGRRRRDHAGRLDPYRDPTRRYARRRVAITRGGQIHAALTPHVFEQEQLRQIGRSVIVHVNTDALTYEAGASFFASNRAELKTESQEVVERAILAAIGTYRDDLRAIERERQEEIIRGKGAADETALRSRLDRIIRAFTRLRAGTGDSTQRASGRLPEFREQEIPSYLRFARTAELGLRPAVPTHLDLLTDAADRTVTDRHTTFRITSDNELISTRLSGGHSGRWRVEIICSPDAPVGMRAELSAYMERSGVWRVDADRACRLIVEPPPPLYEGNDPPTFMRFRSQAGSIHVRQGGARITIETDAVDTLFEHASLEVSPPSSIQMLGHSHPREGEIRLNLSVPEDSQLGPAGRIDAVLNLPDGSRLLDSAILVIEPRIEPAGLAGSEEIPDYKIIDVRQFPTEAEESWANMPKLLDAGSSWNSEDVAAYETNGGESENGRKIVFYLNADSGEMNEAERRIAERRPGTSVDTFRLSHRTLLCYHLYQKALVYQKALAEIRSPSSQSARAEREDNRTDQASDRYDAYRDEMIRVNRTLLYAQREFYESMLESDPEADF